MFFNLSKTLGILILFLAFFLLPVQARADNYGDGLYNSGLYGAGQSSNSNSNSNAISNSGDSGNSTGDSLNCSALKPGSAPDLFQINPGKNSVTLFFSPSSGQRDRYFVAYGTSAHSEQYGFDFMNGNDGVISVDVSALKPNTTYYFEVRAGNGCQPGDWSNELAAKTGQRFVSYKWMSLLKIVSLGIRQKIAPHTVSNAQVDVSRPTSLQVAPPVENTKPTFAAPKVVAPTVQPQAQTPTPSLITRIGDFFKKLF